MTIGILGGGQLGRMLVLAGAPLGLKFKIFDPSSDATAGQIAPLSSGDIGDFEALERFADELDVATYEWENVPIESARFLAERVPVFPDPRALETAQDRLREKWFLSNAVVPTPDFAPVDSREELEIATRYFDFPTVLKTRRGGYDGKGQMILRDQTDALRAWDEMGDAALILERFVPFERELSVLAVRGRDGEKRFYPLVENHHAGGILRLSLAPAPDLTPKLQNQAEAYASWLLDELDYVGVLALELFQVGDGLLANEIAPRVHNSGHWTIEGAGCSQFENHVRAVAGLPLGSTEMRAPCAAMVNLIGHLPPLESVLAIPGAHAHFYGKTVKPNRKVGHITLVADDEIALRERVEMAQELARGN